MKQILIILGLFASVSTFAQSPRIKLNQITKDTVKGSVLISSPSDSGMVYSRDFYVAYGADTVLILYGDTLAATSGIISSVLSDGVTITGNGTSGNELKVDTATVISTIKGLVDTLTARGYLTANQTITLSGDVTGSGTTAIEATVVDDSHNHIISNVDFLQDSLNAKANDSDLNNYLLTSNYIVDSTRINATGDTAYYYQNGVLIGTGAIAGGGGTTYNNISETADTVYVAKYLDVDTSTLYVDAVNNRVGIGKSSPFYKLDVLQISSNATKRSGSSYGMFVENDVTNDDEASYQGYAYGTTLRYKGTAGTNHSRGVIGYNSSAFNYSTGTVDNMAGFYLDLRNLSSGTITNAYGARIIDFGNTGGGTITNKYGFLTAISTSGATNAWNIYASGNAPSYFNGSVGIGTTSPSYPLEMGSGAHVTTGGTWTNASDIKLKTNINYIYPYGLSEVLNLKPVVFDYINGEKNTLGFIAQDVYEYIPEAISSTIDDNGNETMGLKMVSITSTLTKAIQEQQAIIETQASEIDQLKTLITDLTNRLTILENK